MRKFVIVEHLPDGKVQLHLIHAENEDDARVHFTRAYPNKKVITVAEFRDDMAEVR